jgi:hypothetical protein
MQSTMFEKAWAFITIMVDALEQRRRNKRHGQFELEARDNGPRTRTLGTERAAVRQRLGVLAPGRLRDQRSNRE